MKWNCWKEKYLKQTFSWLNEAITVLNDNGLSTSVQGGWDPLQPGGCERSACWHGRALPGLRLCPVGGCETVCCPLPASRCHHWHCEGERCHRLRHQVRIWRFRKKWQHGLDKSVPLLFTPSLCSCLFNTSKQKKQAVCCDCHSEPLILPPPPPPQITAFTYRSKASNHQRCSLPGDEEQRVLSLLPNGALPGDSKRKHGGTLLPLFEKPASFVSCVSIQCVFCYVFHFVGWQACYARISASAHSNRAGPSRA